MLFGSFTAASGSALTAGWATGAVSAGATGGLVSTGVGFSAGVEEHAARATARREGRSSLRMVKGSCVIVGLIVPLIFGTAPMQAHARRRRSPIGAALRVHQPKWLKGHHGRQPRWHTE